MSNSLLQPGTAVWVSLISSAPVCKRTRSISVRIFSEVVAKDEKSWAGDDSSAPVAAKYFFAEMSGLGACRESNSDRQIVFGLRERLVRHVASPTNHAKIEHEHS